MASTDEPTTPAEGTDSAVPATPARARKRAVPKATAAKRATTGRATAGRTTAGRAARSRAAVADAADAERASDQGEGVPDATSTGALETGSTQGAAQPAGAAAVAEASSVAEPVAAEPVKAPRKRASRARKPATATTDAQAPVEVETSALEEPTPIAAVEPTEELAEEATEETTEDAAEALAVPSFGVLFQAPVAAPVRRRASRAASAPAGAPPVAAAAAALDDTLPEPAADAADAQLPADESDDASEQLASHDDDGAAGEETLSPAARRRRRRGGKGRRGRGVDAAADRDTTAGADPVDDTDDAGEPEDAADSDGPQEGAETPTATSRRRTRRRRRGGSAGETEEAPGVVTRVREVRRERDEVTGVRGSTRLEAKKQRRREGREAGRRRQVITEAEFLARRESVERVMVVRAREGRTQIGVLEDGVLVEHYVSRETNTSMAGNIYLGRVQNVLPSMEAAFVDIGRGRNAVLYAGEVNWDAAGMDAGAPKRIENALESGQSVLVQVTKDPIGHKGARLTSQISLPGRYLVYVPDSSMTGISRKLPDTERARLKRILREVVPETAGVIVRTAAEGASEEDLRADVERLTAIWEQIKAKAEGASSGRKGKGNAPLLLHGEPDMTVRVIRDVFNEDFASLVVAGEGAWEQVNDYVSSVAPDLAGRVGKWTGTGDVFAHHRIDEQLAKAMDRKVWLPSGGSLVIDRTEAMTVVDVNTGKFIGSGGNLEETVTRNNIEAAEEIVRQLRLRDIGGIIVIDFIDMVLESNRDLVVRRLLECLGRDRTKHQVAEVTSLGLVQMTRKRVGSGLIEVFSEPCEHCNGRGYVIHAEPVERTSASAEPEAPASAAANGRSRSRRGRSGMPAESAPVATLPAPAPGGPTPAQIAAAAHAAAMKSSTPTALDVDAEAVALEAPADLAEPASAEPDLADVVSDSAAVPPAEAGAEPVDDTAAIDVAHGVSDLTPEPAEADIAGDASADTADSSESAGEPEPDASVESAEAGAQPTAAAAAGRGRRRRGRVVAPAGPPRHGG